MNADKSVVCHAVVIFKSSFFKNACVRSLNFFFPFQITGCATPTYYCNYCGQQGNTVTTASLLVAYLGNHGEVLAKSCLNESGLNCSSFKVFFF